jgi:murein hydrolase activator
MAREQAKGLAVEQATAQTLASTARNLKDLLRRLADERAAAAARLADQERARQEDWQAARAAFKLVPGALLPPVQGRLLHAFAADNGLGRPLQGQILAAMTGEHVLAPADGTVEFAGPFRSYDQLVIINPGAGHLVLLAGMSDISVEQGQSIRAGEPLGTMGDGKSALSLATGLPKPAGPVLYVEIRTGSDPVDPAPWLNNPAAAASAAPISTTASGVADVNNVKVE